MFLTLLPLSLHPPCRVLCRLHAVTPSAKLPTGSQERVSAPQPDAVHEGARAQASTRAHVCARTTAHSCPGPPPSHTHARARPRAHTNTNRSVATKHKAYRGIGAGTERKAHARFVFRAFLCELVCATCFDRGRGREDEHRPFRADGNRARAHTMLRTQVYAERCMSVAHHAVCQAFPASSTLGDVRELFPRCYLVDGDNHRRAHVRDDYVLEVRTLGSARCRAAPQLSSFGAHLVSA